VSIVGVNVGVAVGVGTSEVGFGVSVGGNGVTDGKGVKVSVGGRTGVSDAGMDAVGVQVGGSTTGLRFIGGARVNVGVGSGPPEQPARMVRMINKEEYLRICMRLNLCLLKKEGLSVLLRRTNFCNYPSHHWVSE